MKKCLKPKNDIVFKALFGDNRYKEEILSEFLRTVLNIPSEELEEIIICNPYTEKDLIDDKGGILDIKLKTRNNTAIDVEIQVREIADMAQRLVHYCSKMETEQVKRGDKHYNAKPVISILIANYDFNKGEKAYHHRFVLYDIENKRMFDNKSWFEINTLELKKIPKENDGTELWEWLNFIKCEDEEELKKMSDNTQTEAIRTAIKRLVEINEDENIQAAVDSRENFLWEQAQLEKTAEMKGKAEGRAEGKIEIAKNLIQIGLTNEQIAKGTGLSIEQIK
jgi:predicted transposase/invertase (TIGR01784 family)